MDRWKSICLVMSGMILGLGYAVACGGKESSTGVTGLPGFPHAMAQTGCQSWEVVDFTPELEPVQGQGLHAILPAGYSPLNVADGQITRVWAVRCAP